MHVVVCFKVVPDLDKVIPADWQTFDPVPDTSYAGTMLNCFDEIALELALRMKDQEESLHCTAITYGSISKAQVKRLYAVGFDRVVSLETAEREFSPSQTAQHLANWIEREPVDVVLCGMRAAVCDSGTVPFLLAEQLKMPVVGDVTECALCPEGIALTHETDAGICHTKLQLPAVLAVGNSPIPGLRFATLMAQMAAGKKEAASVEAESVCELPHRLIPQKPTSCHFLELQAEEAADVLLDAMKGVSKA